MAEGQFDKDFGYLMPFLDKVAASVSGIADASAREELARLIADEKPRWARIRQLLSGIPGQAQNQSRTTPARSQSNNEAPVKGDDAAATREPLSFTVGSLRQRSK